MVVILNLWNILVAYLWYRLLKGRLRHTADKQSTGVLIGFFVAGLLSILVTLMGHFAHPIPWLLPVVYESRLLYNVLITGMVEEWAKWLCFIMAVHGGGTIREPQDGILQAAAVGLGFGTLENVFYINAYPDLGIAIRPILTTGGHMIYAAFWGAFYSASVYSNAQGRDPQAYRLAVWSVFVTAVVHGLYNTLIGVSPTIIALLPDTLLLTLSIVVFLHMVRRSPYRDYSLSEAAEAIESLEIGLAFNRKSTILNRRMGLFKLYKGEYSQAAGYFGKAMARAKETAPLRFFKAVCWFAHLGGGSGKSALRKAWSLLSDERRKRLLKELDTLLANDAGLKEDLHLFLENPFRDRRGRRGVALAKELKQRKAARSRPV